MELDWDDEVFAKACDESLRNIEDENTDASVQQTVKSSGSSDLFETHTIAGQFGLYTGEEAPGFDLSNAQEWIYPTNYPVRAYQKNIVTNALFKNTLVCLPTGLGKTFIAAVLMYNFHRWYPKKKVVFMAHSKPLVAQQVQACCDIMGISPLITAELTGNTGHTQRKQHWETKKIFFLTPHVFNNDLARGLVNPESICCVVVDEAHKALGNQAYCQVVKSLVAFTQTFRVLALSATPGSELKAVQQVIQNLMISHLELRTEEDADIKKHLHEKKVEVIVVKLDETILRFKNQLLQVADKYVRPLVNQKLLPQSYSAINFFSLVMKQKQFIQDPSGPPEMRGVFLSNFSVAIALFLALDELVIHGLRTFHNKLKNTKSGEGATNKVHHRVANDTDLTVLLSDLEECLGPNTDVAFDPNVSLTELLDRLDAVEPVVLPSVPSHPKFTKLEEIITQHFADAGTESKVIVFCKSRVCTGEICNFLHRLRPTVKPMLFIGQSSAGSGATSKGFSQAAQLTVMRKFRCGVYNTLVATCVAEEGLDIGEVDLVINFDSGKNSNTQVQRCGRTGRKRAGRVVNLVTEGKEQQNYTVGMSRAKSMNKKLLDNIKKLPLYPDNRRLVPNGVIPKCQEMHLTRPKITEPDKGNTKMREKCQEKVLTFTKTTFPEDGKVEEGQSTQSTRPKTAEPREVKPKVKKTAKKVVGNKKKVGKAKVEESGVKKYDIRYAMSRLVEKHKEKRILSSPNSSSGSLFESVAVVGRKQMNQEEEDIEVVDLATQEETPLYLEDVPYGPAALDALLDCLDASDKNTLTKFAAELKPAPFMSKPVFSKWIDLADIAKHLKSNSNPVNALVQLSSIRLTESDVEAFTSSDFESSEDETIDCPGSPIMLPTMLTCSTPKIQNKVLTPVEERRSELNESVLPLADFQLWDDDDFFVPPKERSVRKDKTPAPTDKHNESLISITQALEIVDKYEPSTPVVDKARVQIQNRVSGNSLSDALLKSQVLEMAHKYEPSPNVDTAKVQIQNRIVENLLSPVLVKSQVLEMVDNIVLSPVLLNTQVLQTPGSPVLVNTQTTCTSPVLLSQKKKPRRTLQFTASFSLFENDFEVTDSSQDLDGVKPLTRWKPTDPVSEEDMFAEAEIEHNTDLAQNNEPETELDKSMGHVSLSDSQVNLLFAQHRELETKVSSFEKDDGRSLSDSQLNKHLTQHKEPEITEVVSLERNISHISLTDSQVHSPASLIPKKPPPQTAIVRPFGMENTVPVPETGWMTTRCQTSTLFKKGLTPKRESINSATFDWLPDELSDVAEEDESLVLVKRKPKRLNVSEIDIGGELSDGALEAIRAVEEFERRKRTRSSTQQSSKTHQQSLRSKPCRAGGGDSDNDSDDLFRPEASKRRVRSQTAVVKVKKSTKRQQGRRNEFVELEAELSDCSRAVSSDEENTSGLDEYDSSFVDEREVLTQAPGVDMTARYLQTTKSPLAKLHGYKIPAPRDKSPPAEVYSQLDLDPDHSYTNDSFCVEDATDNDEKEMSALELAELILESRKRKKKRKREGGETKKQRTKRVRILRSESDEEEVKESRPAVVFIASRQIASAPEVTTCLRARWKVDVQVRSLPGADFIISWRVGVNRVTLSDFSSGSATVKTALKENIQRLRSSFISPALIVENDKNKGLPLTVGCHKTMWSKQSINTLVKLDQVGVQILFSQHKEDTARLVAQLVAQEQSRGHGIVLPSSQDSPGCDARLNFYSALPGVNMALALRLTNKFGTVRSFLNQCDSVESLLTELGLSKEGAARVYHALFSVPFSS